MFRRLLPTLLLAGLCVALWLVPGVPGAPETVRGVRARVLSEDRSAVVKTGLLDYGSQTLEVEVLDGAAKGRRFHANNELRAQPEIDKVFAVGDIVSVTVPPGVGAGATLVARDHWRAGRTVFLFAAFCAALCLFAGVTGAKALFSFVFSCLVVWKLLVPLSLAGWPACWTAFGVTCLLTAVIMYLVAGWTRKGVVATLGASLGVFAGLVLAHLFTAFLKIGGQTLPYAQALVYAGYESLDLADLFAGAVILASSGAVMDLAMDIAAGLAEVVRHRPGISRRELFRSGMRIGRSVVGTMTTTLLLAYSGGYITLLMMFAAQGTHPLDILNTALVSAEFVKTLAGSFALVLVAPFTALVGAGLWCGTGLPAAGRLSAFVRRVPS